MRPYVIATWPGETKLVRRGASKKWDIEGSAGESFAVIQFSGRSIRCSIAYEFSEPRELKKRAIWSVGLLGGYRGHISGSHRLIPVVASEDAAAKVREEVLFLSGKSTDKEDWIRMVRGFLGSIRLMQIPYAPCDDATIPQGAMRSLESNQLDRKEEDSVVVWSFRGGRLIMLVPSANDLAQGATPLWIFEKLGDLTSRSGYKKTLYFSSDKSPLDAASKASALILEENYSRWIRENGLPGTLSDGLSAYALLGLPFPPTMGSTEYKNWREAMP